MEITSKKITRQSTARSQANEEDKLTLAEANALLKTAANEIKSRNSNIRIKYTDRTDDSTLRTTDRKYSLMMIGVKSLYENAYKGYVQNKDFAHCIETMFHEERHHVQFTQQASNPKHHDNKSIQRIQLDDTLREFFPEYYHTAYFDLPGEIEAERHGMMMADAFFTKHKDKLKSIDMHRALVDKINEYPSWYGSRPISSIQDGIQILKKKKQNAVTDASKVRAYKSLISFPTEEGSLMINLKRNLGLTERMEKAVTLYDQHIVMIDCIRNRYPTYFKGQAHILPNERKYIAEKHNAASTTPYDRTIILPDSLKEQPDALQSDYLDYT